MPSFCYWEYFTFFKASSQASATDLPNVAPILWLSKFAVLEPLCLLALVPLFHLTSNYRTQIRRKFDSCYEKPKNLCLRYISEATSPSKVCIKHDAVRVSQINRLHAYRNVTEPSRTSFPCKGFTLDSQRTKPCKILSNFITRPDNTVIAYHPLLSVLMLLVYFCRLPVASTWVSAATHGCFE